MRKSKIILVVGALSIVAAIAAPVGAGVLFTATTKAESKTARLVSVADSTVRGWVDADRGRIEFLESGNGAWPKGSILLTSDGGQTVRFFDPAVKKCRPWVPFFGARAFPPGAAGEPSAFADFRAEKTLDEPGPMIANVSTRHFRFMIAYDASVSGAGAARRLHMERVEDIWAAPDLSDPALAIWLTARARRTGSEKLDGELTEAMAVVRGVPLKRVTVEKVELEGRPPQTTTTTVEVTQLTQEKIAASMFVEPFPCKILKPEDRR
jgi:hypothetical protein